jgi:hypothetical protein
LRPPPLAAAPEHGAKREPDERQHARVAQERGGLNGRGLGERGLPEWVERLAVEGG